MDVQDIIRKLRAELAVRDNMGDEVLRILREATGKRDFHSEMEAAEHAARMILDLQTQLFMEKQSAKEAIGREAAATSREIGLKAELAEARRDGARLDHVIDNFDQINFDAWEMYFNYESADATEDGHEIEHRKAWRKYLDAEMEAK